MMHRLLFTMLLLSPAVRAADPVFQEKGGIIAIEAESTSSRLGKWVKKTDVEGFTGECHLEFTGNKPESGSPDSPLEYRFTVTKEGIYHLSLRARKRLESKRADISNDCYVALEGDFGEAGGAPLKVLREDTKLYGGDPEGWGWTDKLDVSHRKYEPVYQLKTGETYTLRISGRSRNFNFDRILLVHESQNLKRPRDGGPAESKTAGGGDSGPNRLPARAIRTLRDKEGRSVKAELVSIRDGRLTALVNGRRHEIAISSLSPEDREFLAGWTPGMPGE